MVYLYRSPAPFLVKQRHLPCCIKAAFSSLLWCSPPVATLTVLLRLQLCRWWALSSLDYLVGSLTPVWFHKSLNDKLDIFILDGWNDYKEEDWAERADCDTEDCEGVVGNSAWR